MGTTHRDKIVLEKIDSVLHLGGPAFSAVLARARDLSFLAVAAFF
jgi:hypothetical protein